MADQVRQPQPHEQRGTKEAKLAELQKQIDKLIEERENLKGGS